MPPNHLISFSSAEKPQITYWEGDEEKTAVVEGETSILFEGRKSCVGFRGRRNRHRCPYRYEGRIQCPFCGSRDISRIYTRHDFRGYEELEEEFSKHRFSIYLVSFGERIKCGVTHQERVEQRVREQGADYYSEIMRLQGAEAYEMERLLQSHFGFSNAVQGRTKLRLLGQENEAALENAIREIESTPPFNEYLLDTPMPRKLDYPVPEKCTISDCINGEVKGAKGPLLFFENSEGAHVTNMNAMKGMFFSTGSSFIFSAQNTHHD
ncbi:MAG: DUF2797 domain-containing protein [Candidatus Micrarchaeia archaeon]